MKLAIVGGGASGLMMASILKKHNANIEIVILEKLEHVGKKILMSGNGKCNLSNANINSSCYNNEFAYKISSCFDVNKYFNEFNASGHSCISSKMIKVSPGCIFTPVSMFIAIKILAMS